MIVTTTTAIDGQAVIEYAGVVTGEAVLGVNVFRNLFVGLRDIVGGRSAGYKRSLRQARETAVEEMVAESEQMGADAVIGVDVDDESIQAGQGKACSWSVPQGQQSSSSKSLIATLDVCTAFKKISGIHRDDRYLVVTPTVFERMAYLTTFSLVRPS